MMSSEEEGGLLTNRFVQMAYITNDFDGAMKLFGERHGVHRFMELRDLKMETMPGEEGLFDIALAWAGGVQIEIIRPISGADEAYRQVLSGGTDLEMQFHHEAQLVASMEELASLKAKVIEQCFPIAVEGQNDAGVTYFYADCRATIGHFVEYIYYPKKVWSQVDASIPRN